METNLTMTVLLGLITPVPQAEQLSRRLLLSGEPYPPLLHLPVVTSGKRCPFTSLELEVVNTFTVRSPQSFFFSPSFTDRHHLVFPSRSRKELEKFRNIPISRWLTCWYLCFYIFCFGFLVSRYLGLRSARFCYADICNQWHQPNFDIHCFMEQRVSSHTSNRSVGKLP